MIELLSRLVLRTPRTLLENEKRVCQTAFFGKTWRHDILNQQLTGTRWGRIEYQSSLKYSLGAEFVVDCPLDNEAECRSPKISVSCGIHGVVLVSVVIGQGGTLARLDIDSSGISWPRWFMGSIVPADVMPDLPLDWLRPSLSTAQRADTLAQLLDWIGLGDLASQQQFCESAFRVRRPDFQALHRAFGEPSTSNDVASFYAITNGLSVPFGDGFPSLYPAESVWQVDDQWGGLNQNKPESLFVIGGEYENGFILVDMASATQSTWLRCEDGRWFRVGPFRTFVRWLVLYVVEHGEQDFMERLESEHFECFSDFQRD